MPQHPCHGSKTGIRIVATGAAVARAFATKRSMPAFKNEVSSPISYVIALDKPGGLRLNVKAVKKKELEAHLLAARSDRLVLFDAAR